MYSTTQRATPYCLENRRTVFRPRCRGCSVATSESESKALSGCGAEGSGGRKVDRGVAGSTPRMLSQHRSCWNASWRNAVASGKKRQLARFQAAGKEPPKNWKEKYQEPVKPETDGLPQLPQGWCWGKIQDLGEVRLGRQRSPQHHSGPNMRPYLRVANVYEDRLDLSDVKEMNFTPEEYKTYKLEQGDILLNEGQSLELVGRPAMYRGEVPGCCFQNTLVRFRCSDAVLPDYALSVFRAYLHAKRFQAIARWTVNIAHLGGDRFSEMLFPLPPLAEQKEIVSEVERVLTIIGANRNSLKPIFYVPQSFDKAS